LQCNRIVKIENLDKLVNLTELYLSENGIEKIENFEHNTKLETLDLAKNQIKKIEGIDHLKEMSEFWLNDNEISDWKCIDSLKAIESLETVYLERNPIASDVQYRKKLMLTLPWIQKIDATLCTH
jgi:protein phosphatase 1 regulatory subunit 7